MRGTQKIIVFGLGSSCEDFRANCNFDEVTILAYADNNLAQIGKCLGGAAVIKPCDIVKYDYDYVIITARFCDEMEAQLREYGVEKSKIVRYNAEYGKALQETVNIESLIPSEILKYPAESLSLCRMRSLGRKRNLVGKALSEDYVRVSSLELAAEEINLWGIEGCVAELGVYKGEFAQKINALFLDRKLYLFDTFKGFDEKDIVFEAEKKYSGADSAHFSDTSVSFVLQRMPYPENCIIRKGYFPDTAMGIEEKFAFVSIDADLYQPIYEGLKWFYPRMSKHGYIFVHDYNNVRYKGVKEAVLQFAREMDLSFFPLSDYSGSAIIIK